MLLPNDTKTMTITEFSTWLFFDYDLYRVLDVVYTTDGVRFKNLDDHTRHIIKYLLTKDLNKEYKFELYHTDGNTCITFNIDNKFKFEISLVNTINFNHETEDIKHF